MPRIVHLGPVARSSFIPIQFKMFLFVFTFTRKRKFALERKGSDDCSDNVLATVFTLSFQLILTLGHTCTGGMTESHATGPQVAQSQTIHTHGHCPMASLLKYLIPEAPVTIAKVSD